MFEGSKQSKTQFTVHHLFETLMQLQGPREATGR